MAVPPSYLQPLIGYAQNRLGKGESAETILARLERHPDYGALPLSDREAAVKQATVNALATQLATSALGTRPVVESFGKIIPTEEAVGYRVVAKMRLQNGGESDVMVTINAPPNLTPGEVSEMAVEHLNSGAYRPHTGNQYPGTVLVAYIVGVYEGGLQGPNLDLM